MRNCVQVAKNFANGLVAELAGTTVAAIEELDTKVNNIEQYKIEPSVSAVKVTNSSVKPESITFSFFRKLGNSDFVPCNDGTDDLYAELSCMYSSNGTWSTMPSRITNTSYTLNSPTAIDILKCVLYKGTSPVAVSVVPFVSDVSDGTSTSYKMLINASAIAKTASGTYKQTSITIQGKKQTGNGTYGSYSCRFKIDTTTGTNLSSATWTNKYTSSSNVSSYTYTLPSGITGIRCSMYLAGGTSTLLDQIIIPVVTDGANGKDGTESNFYIKNNSSAQWPDGTTDYVDICELDVPMGMYLILGRLNQHYSNNNADLYMSINVSGGGYSMISDSDSFYTKGKSGGYAQTYCIVNFTATGGKIKLRGYSKESSYCMANLTAIRIGANLS